MDLDLTGPLVAAIAGLIESESSIAHSDLDGLFREAGLTSADPKSTQPNLTIGKRKRVQAVLEGALHGQRSAGATLVVRLIEVLQGKGEFRPGGRLAGTSSLSTAQEALRRAGVRLTEDGTLMPQSLDNLSGIELTAALETYVRRARAGAADAALLTGTSKDLIEAVARHVLVEKTGDYPRGMNFPGTLYQPFYACGLAVPSGKALQAVEQELSADPREQLMQCIYLLATTVNRLRNSDGTGHGRPFPATVTDDEAMLAVEAIGLVSEVLLRKL